MNETLRVLIIEDDENDALLLVRVLRRNGFEPDWLRVQTAEEMREALSGRVWDAIISDYMLPQFSAPAALKVTQQSGIDVPFIVVSGVMLEETAVEVMKAGAHDYIRKENLSRLPGALRREIGDAQMRAAHKRSEEVLRQSELRHRLILETAMDGFWLVDPTTERLLEVNDMYCRMSGYSRVELLQMTMPQLDAADRSEDGAARIGQIIQQGGFRFETLHRRKDGSLFNVEISVQFAPEVGRIFAFMRDITERKQAEEAMLNLMEDLKVEIEARTQSEKALRESEERYQKFISQSFEGIYRTELDKPIDVTLVAEEQIDAIYANAYIAECNQALAAMHNFPSADALIGIRLIDAHGGKDNPVNRATFRKFIANGYRSINDETIEYSSGGQPVWFLSNMVGTIENGFLVRLWGTTLIITERKQAEEALRDYAHRLVQSQEDERKRLSRDLHDETVQDLVGLAQRAELARIVLEVDPSAAIHHLEELQALAREMLTKVRRISNDLRPLILEDLGISAAIQFVCDELSAQLPRCEVQCYIGGTERRLNPDVEITAFRIVQQALHNIRAHAPGATHVNVRIEFLDDALAASVQDDGPGFVVTPTPVLLRQGHVGLASMQERASLVNGETTISSSPCQGTTISLWLPYKPHGMDRRAPVTQPAPSAQGSSSLCAG